jgi:phosphate transport system substrate-binding protein
MNFKSSLNLLLLITILAFSCMPRPEPRYIRMKGSDTMLVLMRQWAEEYMQRHPGVSIYTEGGGSAQGIKSLIANEIDICASSRAMLPGEVRQLAEKHNRLGIAYLVAKDALSIYLNPQNMVRDLSLKQLENIFTGKISNWQAVGGENAGINIITRSPNSGTYLYLQEHVLHGLPYTSKAQIKTSTNEVVRAVMNDIYAIGYGGTAYGEEVIHCRIEGIEPTVENVNNDTYPIVRYLYLYTIDTPDGEIKAFLDWVQDLPGQAIVARSGYIPLWEKKIGSSY